MIKKNLLCIAVGAALLTGATIATGQGLAVNATGATANTTAILDVASTTQGMLVPRMTTAQRTAISGPATGLLVYQTDGTAGFYFYTGSGWLSLNSTSSTAGGDLTGTYPNPTIAATAGAGNDAVAAINAGSSTINAANLNLSALNASNLTSGTVPTARLGTGTANSTTFLAGNNTWQTVSGGSGTVTSVSTGNLSPLFTTSVSNATSTPAVTFTASTAAAYTILGNNTGSSAAPTYFGPSLTGTMFSDEGTTSTVLHGNAAGLLGWSAVNLATDVTGTLPATNGGTGNTSYTVGDILYASASGTLGRLSATTAGKVLTSNGTGTAPSWQTASGGGSSYGGFVYPSGSVSIATSTQYVIYASSAAATFTLPQASAYPKGQVLYFSCYSSIAVPNITIAAHSGDTIEDFINGGLTTTSSTGGMFHSSWVTDNSIWYLVGN